jgi:hypothetical protein
MNQNILTLGSLYNYCVGSKKRKFLNKYYGASVNALTELLPIAAVAFVLLFMLWQLFSPDTVYVDLLNMQGHASAYSFAN